MRFPFFRNRDSVKNGILISIRRTGDGFHPGLFRRLRLEQLLLLICLVAQKRIGLKINTKLLEEYPVEIVRVLF